MCAVPSAPEAAGVRVWEVMSRGRGLRVGCPPPEGVDVAYPPVHNHLRLLKKLAPRRHWVSGEAVTRVRLIAGCGRLDCFLASSLLRSSSAFASVARGR